MEIAVARPSWGSYQTLELLRTEVASTCREIRDPRLLETCALIDNRITPLHFVRHDETRVVAAAQELKHIVDGYVSGTKVSACEGSLGLELANALETAVARQHSHWVGPHPGLALEGLEQFQDDILPVCEKARANAAEADVDETCEKAIDLATLPEGDHGSLVLPRARGVMHFVEGYVRAITERAR